jgi:hypothetical protein
MELCRFLEDGDFTDWYRVHCPQEDRRTILAPFQVPDFLSNETSTALNGYFGCKTSLKSPSNSGDELGTLSTSSNSAAS